MNNAYFPKTSFLIGADFAYHCMKTPETECRSVLDGYEYHLKHCNSRSSNDPFIRKWLNLRLHAFERGLHFDMDISPEYLSHLFYFNNSRCPITNIKMTMGLLIPSDWSVDRIVNTVGYVRGNLMVMSTLANSAKGSLSLKNVNELVANKGPFGELSEASWRNISVVMTKAELELTHIVSTKSNELVSNFISSDRDIDTFIFDIFTSGRESTIGRKILYAALINLTVNESQTIVRSINRIALLRQKMGAGVNMVQILKNNVRIRNEMASFKNYMDWPHLQNIVKDHFREAHTKEIKNIGARRLKKEKVQS